MDDQNTPSRREPHAGLPQAPSDYAFPRSAEGFLPWSHAVDRLVGAQNYWLATMRPDGRPHVTPVWGVWVDDALYFDGSPKTRWARNIAANPNASVHLESGEDVVILEGTAEALPKVEDADLSDRIVAAWDAKYGRLHPEPATSGIFRLRPHSARAWRDTYLNDGTRWRFDES